MYSCAQRCEITCWTTSHRSIPPPSTAHHFVSPFGRCKSDAKVVRNWSLTAQRQKRVVGGAALSCTVVHSGAKSRVGLLLIAVYHRPVLRITWHHPLADAKVMQKWSETGLSPPRDKKGSWAVLRCHVQLCTAVRNHVLDYFSSQYTTAQYCASLGITLWPMQK